MKRCFLLVLVLFLVGCRPLSDSWNGGLSLRQQVLNSDGCEFDAVIHANYSDCSYTFTLHCKTNEAGDLSFEVREPETISGITGTISSTSADLRFDDTVLAFDTLADGLLSPVVTPWLFIKTLRGGYIKACEKDDDGHTLLLDDTYRSENLRTHIHISSDMLPDFCEIYWQGKRYLSMDVRNFVFL